MRCQHCGHEVPEGSVFCNRCGYRMSHDMACPHCGKQIPATSVFCPACGKAVDQEEAPAPESTTRVAASAAQQGQTYNEQRRVAQRQAARQPVNAWQQPEQDDDDDDDDDNEEGRSHYNRNLIIGAVLVVLAIALLSMLRH